MGKAKKILMLNYELKAVVGEIKKGLKTSKN